MAVEWATATHYQPGEKLARINRERSISCWMDADWGQEPWRERWLTAGSEDCALQELMSGSLYSRGLATGQGRPDDRCGQSVVSPAF